MTLEPWGIRATDPAQLKWYLRPTLRSCGFTAACSPWNDTGLHCTGRLNCVCQLEKSARKPTPELFKGQLYVT